MKLEQALSTGVLDFKDDRLDVDVVITARLDGKNVDEVFRVVAIAATDGGEDRYYLTSVPSDVLTPDDVATSYTLRWEIELLWKHLKTGVGLAAIRAWRPAAVFALVHAKITSVALARLLELAARPATEGHATGQLAIVLALNRAVPMILALRVRGQNVDLAEMERRLLIVATTLGRSRRQRRERLRDVRAGARARRARRGHDGGPSPRRDPHRGHRERGGRREANRFHASSQDVDVPRRPRPRGPRDSILRAMR